MGKLSLRKGLSHTWPFLPVTHPHLSSGGRICHSQCSRTRGCAFPPGTPPRPVVPGLRVRKHTGLQWGVTFCFGRPPAPSLPLAVPGQGGRSDPARGFQRPGTQQLSPPPTEARGRIPFPAAPCACLLPPLLKAQGWCRGCSPEPQKEDKSHQEGHQGDAVAQVVDDDSKMVVHLVLLLRPERGAEVRFPHSPTPAPRPNGGTDPVVAGTERAMLTTAPFPSPEGLTLPWSSPVSFGTVSPCLSVCLSLNPTLCLLLVLLNECLLT